MAASITADNVVIGTSLAALEYAENNNCLILFNIEPSFFSFQTLTNEEVLYERWQRSASLLAINGLNPFGDKISQIRIKEEDIQVICHNRKYNIIYNNIAFFDDENIEDFPFDKIPLLEYRVCDWFQVTSGTNHEHWLLETEDRFVNKIYFQKKITLPKYKDCVSESFLKQEELNHVDYSSTMSRLKTIDVMTKAGILGTKHTKTYRYPIKMDLKERQVFKIKEEIVDKKDNYMLDTREVK
jgi:hypothetical protein